MRNQFQRFLLFCIMLMLFVNLPAIVRGQESSDSLIEQLKTTSNDSLKADILVELTAGFVNSDLRKAKTYSQEALSLIDSTAFTEQYAKILSHMAAIALEQREYDAVILNGQKSLTISKALKLHALTSSSYYTIGRAIGDKRELASAIKFMDSSIVYADKSQNLKQKSSSLSAQCIFYLYFADHVTAMQKGVEALELAESLQDSAHIATANLNLGNVHLHIRELNQASIYLNAALPWYERIKDTTGLTSVYTNLGLVYYLDSKRVKALTNFRKVLDISVGRFKDPVSMAGININMANIFIEEKDYAAAIRSYNAADKLLAHIEQHPYKAAILMGLGHVMTMQKKYAEGAKYTERALAIGKKFDYRNVVKGSLKRLPNIYEKQGKYKPAFESFKEYIALRDTILNQDNIAEITETRMSFEFAKEQLADSLMFAQTQAMKDLQIQEKDARLAKERNQRFMLYGGLGLLFLLIGAVYRAYKIQMNAKNAIAIEKTEAENQRKRAEYSERYKEQFLANMSHEIRTPMHAISGMTKILMREDHLPNQDIYLDAMDKSTGNLLVILNDILDLSKIEAGKIEIKSIPVRLRNVLSDITQLLQPKANEKGITLNTSVDYDVPEVIMGDPTRINQILVNLIGNSIKFTEQGIVDVYLQRMDNKIQFAIKDTGKGISEDKLDQIFKSFEQISTKDGHKNQGSGLGLTISKQLVELQGGKLWAESSLGNGSSFFVELPLIPFESKKNEEASTTQNMQELGQKLSGLKVLIAEDTAFNTMVLTNDLQHFIPDISIKVAVNGQLAVEFFDLHQFDVVLMDVDMPIMNGLQASEKIRAMEAAVNHQAPTPIIAMTASLLKSELNLCTSAGMNNYIPKPYKYEELIGVIHDEVKRNRHGLNN